MNDEVKKKESKWINKRLGERGRKLIKNWGGEKKQKKRTERIN